MLLRPHSTTPNTQPYQRLLFSWLHLSDIHFGHGDDTHQSSQQRIVSDLLVDVRRLLLEKIVPAPQVLLLTGDIAFKASRDEYVAAEEWLFKLINEIGIKRRHVFTIPGNHDVQRTDVSDRQAFRLISALRNGEPIDPALRDAFDRTVLTKRFTNYLTFAKNFAPACMSVLSGIEQWLFWSHCLQPQDDLNVYLLGLNTSLLCNDDNDSGRLVMGVGQMKSLIERDARQGELVIVLTHHPLTDLRDARSEHIQAISTKAQVHLSGHVHESSSIWAQPGSGVPHIKIVAGAVHGEAGFSEHSYSIAAVVQGSDGVLELRVWPRRWLARSQHYDWDHENTAPDQQYASYTLKCSLAMHPFCAARASTVLEPLPDLPQPATLRADYILDAESARDWLSDLGLDRSELLLWGNASPGIQGYLQLPPHQVQFESDVWRASTIGRMVAAARRDAAHLLAPLLLHGIRGVGKTVLLLRYVAAGRNDVRLFVDCGSNGERSLRDAHDQLRSQLNSIKRSDVANQEFFIGIDGLDIACRSQAIKEKEHRAEKLLAREVETFRRIVAECLGERRVCLLFTSDDAPEWRPAVGRVDSWATKCFRDKIEGEWKGTSYRLEAQSRTGPDAGLFLDNMLRLFGEDLSVLRPFLTLPVFFDAARDADPGDLPHLSTKRQFLSLGSKRVGTLAKRRHLYYATLDHLNSFMEALNTLPALRSDEAKLDSAVSLIEKELTGDWMYLFELSSDEIALADRLEQLHQWLIEDGWRYSDTYALSNVVSLLALLGRFHVTDKSYSHCNLRNAQIINAARIVRSLFHGVDFGGAMIHGATITDGKFIGADFTGASFEDTVLEGKSKFVGCKFDSSALKGVTRGTDVHFVESLPDGWTP